MIEKVGGRLMNAIKATWTNGQVQPASPVNWPEGTELSVEPLTSAADKIGLDESEWRDDPEAVAAFAKWIATIEPPELTDEERVRFEEFDRELRRHNLAAVARQMAVQD